MPDMGFEVVDVELLSTEDGLRLQAEVTYGRPSSASALEMRLSWPGGVAHADGPDYFACLQHLRRQLEEHKLIPLCAGARVDCWASGMQRDMGLGRTVYELSAAPRGTRAPVLDLFEAASPELVGTVDDQLRWHQAWLGRVPPTTDA